MEDYQRINCSVASCRYNDKRIGLCQLKQIIVTPVQGIDTKQPDESMCSSYVNQNKKPY